MSRTASEYLAAGAGILADRGKQYDKDNQQQERSMQKIVKAFETITGKSLTEAEGWEFMALVKQVRAFSRPGVFHEDSWQDGINYLALGAEAAGKDQAMDLNTLASIVAGVPTLSVAEQIAYQGYVQHQKSRGYAAQAWANLDHHDKEHWLEKTKGWALRTARDELKFIQPHIQD